MQLSGCNSTSNTTLQLKTLIDVEVAAMQEIRISGKQRWTRDLRKVQYLYYCQVRIGVLLNTFSSLDSLAASWKDVASRTSPGQLGEIKRDVARTLPRHPFFQPNGIGQDMLGRILAAVAAARPVVGYCQVAKH